MIPTFVSIVTARSVVSLGVMYCRIGAACPLVGFFRSYYREICAPLITLCPTSRYDHHSFILSHLKIVNSMISPLIPVVIYFLASLSHGSKCSSAQKNEKYRLYIRTMNLVVREITKCVIREKRVRLGIYEICLVSKHDTSLTVACD